MGVQGPTKDLGPCRVIFDGTDLGETFGDVLLRYTTEESPVHEDRQGTTPVDLITTGQAVEVEVPLTRLQIANLAKVIPGGSGSGTSGSKMTVINVIGESLADRSAELILKPIVNGVASTDNTEWAHVYKAAPRADMEIAYSVQNQRVYKTMFTGFFDDTNKLWGIGDQS